MRVRTIVGATLLVLLGSAAPGHAASITVQSRIVQPGESFSLDIGIFDVVNLGAFGFDVTYDPDVISLTGVSEGEFLARGGPTLPCTIGDPAGIPCFETPGLATIGNFLLAEEGVSDNNQGGVLATLLFQTVRTGVSPIVLSMVSLSTPLLDLIPVETVGEGRVEVVSSTPKPVPEPSTLLLVGAGAAALARSRRRRPNGSG